MSDFADMLETEEIIDVVKGINIDRLRELVKADADGRVPKLGIGSKVYTLGGRFAYAIGKIAECTVSMVSMSKKDMKWRYRCRQPRVDHETDSWQDEFFEDQIGIKYFITRAEAESALASEDHALYSAVETN